MITEKELAKRRGIERYKHGQKLKLLHRKDEPRVEEYDKQENQRNKQRASMPPRV